MSIFHPSPVLTVISKCDFSLAALSGRGTDRQIPLLEDVFQAFPNMPINIDIKVNNDVLMEKVDLGQIFSLTTKI